MPGLYQTLDPSNVVAVTVSLTPAGLQQGNINTAALFSKEIPSWAGTQPFKVYQNATDVESDFGSTSNAFAIATMFFAQTPNPLATDGYLVIIPRLQSPSLETTQAAIARTINLIYYFGILLDEELAASAPSTFASLAAYVMTLPKVMAYCSSNIADLNPSSPLDNVRAAGQNQVRCFYYGNALLNGASSQQTQMFAAAWLGRALSTDFGGSKTVGIMGFKQLTNITPDQTIGETQLTLAKAAGVDLYVSFGNFPCMYEGGANAYWDQIYARFWLKFALQVAGFNFIALANTKVPQTNDGMRGLANAYAEVLQQAVTNGYAAPGEWQSATLFGPGTDLVRNIADVGYYLFYLPIGQQLESTRIQRIAPLVQIAIKEAGAIESSDVICAVNP